MIAVGFVLLGAILFIAGAGEMPMTGYGVIALIIGAVLGARDQLSR